MISIPTYVFASFGGAQPGIGGKLLQIVAMPPPGPGW